MNTLLRPIIRTGIVRHAPFRVANYKPSSAQLLRPALNSKSLLRPGPLHLRGVASSVSNRPGSQTIEHATQNVKEELGNSASDLAKAIAGANMTSHTVTDHAGDSFVGAIRLETSDPFSFDELGQDHQGCRRTGA